MYLFSLVVVVVVVVVCIYIILSTGDCMLEMVASHRDIRENQEDWVSSYDIEYTVTITCSNLTDAIIEHRFHYSHGIKTEGRKE